MNKIKSYLLLFLLFTDGILSINLIHVVNQCESRQAQLELEPGGSK